MPARTPLVLGTHHAAVIGSDHERSKRFYVEVLGLEVVSEVYREARRSHKLDLRLPDGTQVELFSFPDPPKRPSDPEACGLQHLAFVVTDLDAAVAHPPREPAPRRRLVHQGQADPGGVRQAARGQHAHRRVLRGSRPLRDARLGRHRPRRPRGKPAARLLQQRPQARHGPGFAVSKFCLAWTHVDIHPKKLVLNVKPVGADVAATKELPLKLSHAGSGVPRVSVSRR